MSVLSPAKASTRAKTVSTRAQHVRSGAERVLELGGDKIEAGAPVRLLEMQPHRGEFARRRALK